MSSIEQVRQLGARSWKPVFSALSAALVAANGLKAAGVPLDHVPGVGATAETKWWLIAAGVVVYVLIRFPRVTFAISRLILGPPPAPVPGRMIFRGPLPYGADETPPGRKADFELCWPGVEKKQFFILEGESGTGKSSFLNSLVLPRARKTFDVIECRVSDDPLGKLYSAIGQETYRPSDRARSVKDLRRALKSRGRTVKSTLICIDQFEELFTTAEEEIRLEFLRGLMAGIKSQNLRVLIVIRNDFLDLLLRGCATVDPDRTTLELGNWYTLKPFRKDEAEAVLDEMLEPLDSTDPLLAQQIRAFRNALVGQLLRPSRDDRLYKGDGRAVLPEKTVLPVELQTVGMMLESFGVKSFSVAGLRRHGGKLGLLRAFIEDARTYVWRKTGVDGDKALLILRQLVSPAGTKWAQSPQAIADKTNVPSRQVERVLRAFEEKYLVKVVPIAQDAPAGELLSQRFELLHEHVVQVLSEAPVPILQKARDAEERFRFWNERTNIADSESDTGAPQRLRDRMAYLLAQPIPLIETLRLWPFARRSDQRELLVRNLRGFGRRVIAALVPLALVAVCGLLWTRSDAYQLQLISSHARLSEAAPTTTILDETDQRNFAPFNWAEGMGYLGRISETLVATRDLNVHYKDQLLESLIVGLIKADRADAALVTLPEIKTDYYHCGAATRIANAFVELGRGDESAGKILEEAHKRARQVKDNQKQSELLVGIAEIWIKMRRNDQVSPILVEALVSAREVSYEGLRAPNLAQIAGAFRTADLTDQADQVSDEALATALKADHIPSARHSSRILQTLVKMGNDKRGLAGVRQVKDDPLRFELFVAVAGDLIEIGKTDDASHALDEALAIPLPKKSPYRGWKSSLPYTALFRVGRGDEALRLLDDKGSPNDRNSLLTEVAAVLGRAGKPFEALRAVDEITKGRALEDSCFEISTAFARIGQASEALAVIDRIPRDYRTSLRLVEIAETLFAAGDIDSPNTLLDKATSAVRENKRDSMAGDSLARIAEALGKFGRTHEVEAILNEALATARAASEEERSRSLAAVAKSFARLGFYRQARLTGDECNRSLDQVDAYATVLVEYAKQIYPQSKFLLETEAKEGTQTGK